MAGETRIEAADVASRLSVFDVLEIYGIEPPRRGGRMPCPVHNGDNPNAFSIYQAGDKWHCFTCSKGGDVFALAMELGEIDFPTALKKLAEAAGIGPGVRSEEDDRDIAARRERRLRFRGLEAQRQARLSAIAGELQIVEFNLREVSNAMRDELSDGGPTAALDARIEEYSSLVQRRDKLEMESSLLADDQSPRQWAEILSSFTSQGAT